MGIRFDKPQIDLDKMRAWKDQVIDKLTKGLLTLSKRRKIQFLEGEGDFRKDLIEHAWRDRKQARSGFRQAIFGHRSYSTPLLGLSIVKGSRIMDSAGALELPDIPGPCSYWGAAMLDSNWARFTQVWEAGSQ